VTRQGAGPVASSTYITLVRRYPKYQWPMFSTQPAKLRVATWLLSQ
jgi:hypothetical protein